MNKYLILFVNIYGFTRFLRNGLAHKHFKVVGLVFMYDNPYPPPPVYIYIYISIERILHGRAEIRNFSSRVENFFRSERSKRVK